MASDGIAIIGAGPAGSTLAALLAKAGKKVAIFDSGKRPALVVGESLIPSVVPVLRELGIEDAVRSFGTLKPGASFFARPDDETTITFAKDCGRKLPSYSFNVPRDLFDKELLDAARRSGAAVIEETAKLEVEDRSVCLAGRSLELAREVLGGAPALLVDSTGRARLFSKLLSIGEKKGKRSDAAIFAHLTGVEIEHPGNIHINRLRRGWSWRIPLPGRVSVGVVIKPCHLEELGRGVEEQYDRLVAEEPILSMYTRGAKRVTPVMKYNNYQLISDAFFGPGWALVGDAAGFVDPIFSSGLHLSLEGARALAGAILAGGRPADMLEYDLGMRARLSAWQHVVERFYGGQIFGLSRAARLTADRFPWSYLVPVCHRQVRRVISGMVHTDSLTFRSARYLMDMRAAHVSGQRLGIR